MKSKEFDLNIAGSTESEKKLAYTDEFKQLFLSDKTEHSGKPKKEKYLISSVIALIDFLESPDAVDKPQAYEADGIRVEAYKADRDYRGDRPHSGLYKITYKGRCFFLKKQGQGYREHIYAKYGHSGYNEAVKSAELNAIVQTELSDLGPIRVVKYYLGYSDKKNNYFVAEFVDFPNLAEYHWNLGNKAEELRMKFIANRKNFTEEERLAYHKLSNEGRRISERKGEIWKRLKAKYIDVDSNNMLYNPRTEEIVIVDVNPQSK